MSPPPDRAPYPPERHVLRDLAIASQRLPDGGALASAPIHAFVCDDRGAVRVGVIATLVDVAAASAAVVAVHPDRTATIELGYQSARPGRDGPLLAVARILRLGTRQVEVGIEVADGRGSESLEGSEPLGAGLVSFRRLRQRADHARVGSPQRGARRASMALPGSGLSEPLLARIGLRILDPATGAVEIANAPYVRNSFGTLNGGMVATALEVAGELAARAASGEPLAVADLSVHYVGQSGPGPLRTRARVLRAGREHAACRIELYEPGAEGAGPGDGERLLAIGTLTAARL